MKTNIHINSLSAFRENNKELTRREIEIILFLVKNPGKYTDRQLAAQMGYNHRSAVQPRVSDLIRNGGILEQTGKTRCAITGKTVRQISLSQKATDRLPSTWSAPEPKPEKKPATPGPSVTGDLFGAVFA